MVVDLLFGIFHVVANVSIILIKNHPNFEKFYIVWKEETICKKMGPTTTFQLNLVKSHVRIKATSLELVVRIVWQAKSVF